jgi:hypothetical protein
VIARLLLAWVAVLGVADAQEIPQPYAGAAIRGQVVDADTGKAIEGAVLVARWNWLHYFVPGFHGSPRFEDRGETLNVSEAVSNAQGRFTLAGFAPTVRGMGKLEENAPSVTAFKSGYEPFQRLVGSDAAGPIRLKRHDGAPAELAAKIAAIQGERGLHWLYPKETGKAMPRMVLAIHREKVRLGEHGAAILGAQRLAGRAGQGEVVDAQTNEPVRGGVVSMAWTMRRVGGGKETMRLVQTKRAGTIDSDSRFYVSPWRIPGPDTTPGWEADKDAPATVRIYVPGYRRAEVKWDGAGGRVRVQKLPATREAVLAELRAMRADIDAEAAATDRAAWLDNERALLALLADQCRGLTPDARAGICYPPDSDVVAHVQKPRPVVLDREDQDGARAIRVEVARSAERSQISAAQPAVASGGYFPGQRKPVGGFTIEPGK